MRFSPFHTITSQSKCLISLVGLHHESIFGIFIFSPFVWFHIKIIPHFAGQFTSNLCITSYPISHRLAWLALDIINCLGTNWIPQRMLPVCCAHVLISIPLHSTMGRWKSTTLAIYSMRHVWCQADYTVYSFIYHSYYIPDVFYMTCTVYHLQCNKIFLFGTFILPSNATASLRCSVFCHLFYSLHDFWKKKIFFPLTKTPLQQDTNMRIQNQSQPKSLWCIKLTFKK